MHFPHYGPVTLDGWQAKLVSVQDISPPMDKKINKISSAMGELRLLPHYRSKLVSFGDSREPYHLNSFFRTYFVELSNWLVRLPENARLIVSGTLDRRHQYRQPHEYPELETICVIKDVLLDSTKGKRDPYSAVIKSGGKKELAAAMGERYALECPHCGGGTEEIHGTLARFCPVCV